MRFEAGLRSQRPMSHSVVKPASRRASSSSSGIWSRRWISRWYFFESWSSHTRVLLAIMMTFGIQLRSGVKDSMSSSPRLA